MTTLLRLVTRLWVPQAGTTALPANASSLIFLVRSAADLVLFPVTAFMAWELASNAYAVASAEDKSLMRVTVRDDAVGARLDLASALAMRQSESDLLEVAMVPVTLLAKAQQLSSLAVLRTAERNNVARIEVSLEAGQVDTAIVALDALKLPPALIEFKTEGAAAVELSLMQVTRLAGVGTFADRVNSDGGFILKITASDVLELATIEKVMPQISIKAESILTIDVEDSLDAALGGLRALMAASNAQKIVLQLDSADQAFLTLSTLSLYRSMAEKLQIDIADGSEGLSLKLPGPRQVDRLLSNISELLALAPLGIDKITCAGAMAQVISLSQPEWKLINALGMEIDPGLSLVLGLRSASDIRALIATKIGTELNQATVVVDNLPDLGLKNAQDLVRQGYFLSTADARAIDSVALDDEEIALFLRNPAEWIYLFESAGVREIDLEQSAILTEQATRALLDSTITLSDDPIVLGTLSLDSLTDDFFDHVVQRMQDKRVDALELIAGPQNSPTVYSLGQTLEQFETWALNPSADLRMKGFSIGIPEYLLDRQSAEWVHDIESNLSVKIVGVTDSDIQIIFGG